MKLHAFDADNNLLYSCHHSDTEKLVNMMCNHEVSAVSCGDVFVWREGWSCSRIRGHDGPCAASPVDDGKLMIVDGYVYKAAPKYIPVRDKKGDPLRMERDGWETVGCPLGKITFHDSPSRDNPLLTMLRNSGMIVAEQTKGY